METLTARGSVELGDELVFVGPRNHWFGSSPIVAATADGEDIEVGTRAKVVHIFAFDYPYLLELEDGRRYRSGGNLFRQWQRPELGVGDIVRVDRRLGYVERVLEDAQHHTHYVVHWYSWRIGAADSGTFTRSQIETT